MSFAMKPTISSLLLLGVLVVGVPPLIAAAPRPNIILILADDLGWGDVGCYGQKKIQTPNIDQVAREGMKFAHFYAGASVCAPSRSVLMTGRHGGRTRVRGNASSTERLRQSLLPEDVTVAEALKQAGYATALVGKWGLGDFDTPGQPLDQGFDHFFGYLDQVHAHMYYPQWLWRDREKLTLPNQVRPIPVGKEGMWGMGGVTLKGEVYSPQLMLEQALKFIEQNKHRPFFLYFATPIPHANNEAAADLGNGAEVPDLGPYNDKPWPKPEKGYAAMVTHLDNQVGAILGHLKTLGIDDNTLVIFSSDNGPELQRFAGYDSAFFDSTGPFRGHKRDHTDGGIRVPFIARWPAKVRPGTVSAHVGYFGDFFATAAELAGVKPPAGLDSISLVPTLLGRPNQQRHEFLYWEYHTGNNPTSQAALLDGRWKGIQASRQSPLELYDLVSDPGETRNVAAEHPDIAARLAKHLSTARSDSPNWPLR
jgi:arylsulfatase A-like enzyme